jgi:hypothetical protein
MAEIDAFLRRGRPTSREVTILLGAFAALERRCTAPPAAGRPPASPGRPRAPHR